MLSVVDESFLNNDNDSNNFTSYIGYKRWYLDQIVKSFDVWHSLSFMEFKPSKLGLSWWMDGWEYFFKSISLLSKVSVEE